MDDTTPQQPPSDDLTNAADEAASKLDGATDGIDTFADNLSQAVENGIDTAEQKLDGFINGLDKFLGKF